VCEVVAAADGEGPLFPTRRSHCCRAVNITKAKLEELFIDELARLQPTAGFMRLVKDRVLHAWRDLKADAKERFSRSSASRR
jgi:hypothetical protein